MQIGVSFLLEDGRSHGLLVGNEMVGKNTHFFGSWGGKYNLDFGKFNQS